MQRANGEWHAEKHGWVPRPGRRRRRLLWSMLAIAVVGVSVVIAVVAAPSTSKALAAGVNAVRDRGSPPPPQIANSCGGASALPGEPPVEGVLTQTDDGPFGSEDDKYVIPYSEGTPIAIRICLSSKDTVRINDIRLPETLQFPILEPGAPPLLDETDPSMPWTGVSPARPFVPVDLRPGELRSFALVGVMRNCDHYGAGTDFGFRDLDLDYEYRGRKGTVSIETHAWYLVRAPQDAGCPARQPR